MLSPDRQKQSSDRDATGVRAVELSAPLAADLGLLSAALEDSRDDLKAWLESFVEDLRGAIGSYLGLTMTVGFDGQEISFTLSERATQAGTSLCLPLESVADSEPGSTLVLYAATPGAFVDLAADLAWALELDPSLVVLDEHLGVPVASNAVSGLRQQGTVNRAVGALIERGHTPELAHHALRHHAESEGWTVLASAEWILSGLHEGAPDVEV